MRRLERHLRGREHLGVLIEEVIEVGAGSTLAGRSVEVEGAHAWILANGELR